VHSWFVGKIKRVEAEARLGNANDGAFLIRESESAPGLSFTILISTFEVD
jgi:hypothetical protein